MKAPTTTRWLAYAVVALFAVSALGAVGTAAAPAVLGHNPAPTPAAIASSPAAATVTSNAPSHDLASQAASAALAAARLAGVSSHYVFPPRPSATPAQISHARDQGYVAPLYTGQPAPMGLGYYGLSAAPNGSVVPTVLNTTSVQGYVDATETGIVGSDLFQSSPDSYGIQLNAVTTNITLFNESGYSFWTQNVVEFYPDSGFLVLVTNVWNFSGPDLSSNVFYSHGPYGNQVGTTFYYAEAALAGISYPFNLTLTMTSGLTDGRNNVTFTVGLSGPDDPTFSIPYDWVVFNSTTLTSPPVTIASPYTADGTNYNAFGLTNDFELVLCGPGGGSQVDLSSADATLGLAYWNGAAYVSVPSALNYGGETGETATGATVTWSNSPGGPSGMPTYGTVATGPSFLNGLWNASGAEGSYPVTISADPENAFNVVTPLGGNPNFQVDEPAVAPGVFGDTLQLMPGNYSVTTELSDYAPVTTTIDVTGPMTVPAELTYTPGEGIYTPLWAMSNEQVAAISSSGAGTPSSPYLLFGGPSASLSSNYGLYNDFTFPVYPGIFLMGTSASININHEPSFTAATNTFQFPGPYLPSTNSLQLWFWNVTNVSITNTTFTGGWFGQNAWYPVSFDTFNVIFYASTGNLIYKDTFQTPSQGLLLFQGSDVFGPSTGGGGSNTIFGTVFSETAAPVGCPSYPRCESLMDYSLGLGLQLAEGNDTIVNNAFATPTTAWQLPLNMYSGYPYNFTGINWNLTGVESSLPTLANFPNLPFTGTNIIGGATQGGNYWWDYGYPANPFNGASNPLGILPYNEHATTLLSEVYGCTSYYCASYIYPGGDYKPLTSGTSTFYVVSVYEVGLPSGAPWGIGLSSPTLLPFPGVLLSGVSYVTGPPLSFILPNGTYSMSSLYAGEVIAGSSTFGVTGSVRSVTVVFHTLPTYGYLRFKELGLPGGTEWTVAVEVSPGTFWVNTSTAPANIVFLLPRGIYNFSVANTDNGYQPKLIGGEVRLGGQTVVPVKFIPYTFNVGFVEAGLLAGTVWSVQLTGTISGHPRVINGHSHTSTILLALPNGTYTFTVHPVRGYSLGGTGTGTLIVSGSNVTVNVTFTLPTYLVTFTESGLPSATLWSVTIGATTVSSLGTTVEFNLTNGTYHYSIGSVVGYVSSGVPHLAHVHGGPVSVSVTFRHA